MEPACKGAKTTGVCRQSEKGQPGVQLFNFRHLADKEKIDLQSQLLSLELYQRYSYKSYSII